MLKQEELPYYKFHPNVLKAYQDADFLEDYVPNAGEENEKNFWIVVEQAKAPVKREITKIVRLKKGGKEYFYYHEELKSKDHVKNEIHCYHTVGKYNIPEFNSAYDPKTGRVRAKEILRQEEVYEFEWPDKWTPELEDLVPETCDLLVITLGRKYGGYSFIDFKERSFDELVMYGRFGTFNPVAAEGIKKRAKQTS